MADEITCPRCAAPNPVGTGFCGKCGTSLEREQEGEVRDPMLGSFVGDRFMVQRKLGEGGMGVVYLAEQTAINRKVALKVLNSGINDENLYARFRNEAASASKLSHPSTITIYDFGKTDTGSLYIAMEFVEGSSLDDEIAQNGALDWKRTCQIGVQICGSLQEAHDAGIIHRDLKPENVMLSARAGKRDVATVLDFGIAKILEDDGQDQRKALTKTGMVFGTPQYMSPEQIRGEKVDPRSDIYSTGVILYQMLTGVLPFTAETPMGLLTKHLMDTPPPLSEAAPAVAIPEELEQLVLKTLAKEADQRPASMKELGEALESIIATGVAAGGRATTVTSSAVPGGDTAAPAAAGSAVPRTEVSAAEPFAPPAAPKKGKGGLIAGIVVGAVVVLGGGGTAAWYFLAGPGSGPPEPQHPTGYQQAGLTNPPPLQIPSAGQQQAVAGQQQPTVGQQQTGPAPLPAIPVEPDGGAEEQPSAGGSGGKKPGGKKPKEAACTVVTISADKVAKQIAGGLKAREKAIKECSKVAGDEASATIGFSVLAKKTSLDKVTTRASTSGQMANCLKAVVSSTSVSEPADKGRNGTATFKISRKKGVVSACSVGVDAKTSARMEPVPKKDKDKKDKDKQPKPDKPKIKIIKRAQ